MRALRLPVHPPGRLRLVRLPHQYRGARLVRSRSGHAHAHHRPGQIGTPAGLSNRLSPTECMGSPRFLGNPLVRSPRSWTPGRPARPAIPARRCCRHLPNSAGPSQFVLSRLYHAALALAVYASRPGLLRDSRKTRFRLVASLYRAGAPLLGRSGRFPCHGLSATSPPPPGFAWRDRNDKPESRLEMTSRGPSE